MAEFNKKLIIIVMTILCANASQAYICMCAVSNCVIINPTTDLLTNADKYCSVMRKYAPDVSLIRFMESKLPGTAFKMFTNMSTLAIFQGLLQELDSDVFVGSEKLDKIVIQRTQLKSLADYAFKGADNITDLTLAANPLTEISEKAFANLAKLTFLTLSHSPLKSLSKNIFENNRKLKTILLYSNELTSIDPATFDGLNDLTRLDLAENLLTSFDFKQVKVNTLTLSNNSFTSLTVNEHVNVLEANYNKIESIIVEGTALRKLSLVGNRIRDLTNLTKLENLTTLNLAKNPLDPNTSFESWTKLEELLLQSTYINCTPNTFANLQYLETLDLSYNNITKVDFKIFRKQDSLKVISYVGNRIEKFNYIEAKEYLPSLRVLEICKNGWNVTYFQSNVARMKRLNIQPDIHGFGLSFWLHHEFSMLCSNLGEEDSYDEYSDDRLEHELEESFSAELLLTRSSSTSTTSSTTTTTPTTTTATTTTSSTTTVTPVDGTSATLTSSFTAAHETTTSQPPATTSARHNILEHDTNNARNVPLAVQNSPPSASNTSSPVILTLQILAYILAVFGLVCLVGLGYLWQTRRLTGLHQASLMSPSQDDVQLI